MAQDFNSKEIQEFVRESLGEPLDIVHHSVVPFNLGYENGGGADVYMFKRTDGYICYVTGDLIGQGQKESDAGNYEFVIIMPENEEWGTKLISSLAYYTLDASINSYETMDLGDFGKEIGLTSILFNVIATKNINGKSIGLMLIVGITNDELNWKLNNSGKELVDILSDKNIYPRTIPNRKSVIK